MQPHEVLLSVFIPYTRELEFVKEFKQSPRREDDIAIVNAGVRLRLEPGSYKVADAAVAFGGVAATPINAPAVAKALIGKPLDQATLSEVLIHHTQRDGLLTSVHGVQ